jgi:hypothetical protein
LWQAVFYLPLLLLIFTELNGRRDRRQTESEHDKKKGAPPGQILA